MKRLLILFVMCLPIGVMAQDSRKITGRVVDAITGEALPGATIFLDPDASESKLLHPAGTATDMDGKFTLVVPNSIQYVVVSFIGYESLKVSVTDQTEFIFHLKEELNQLDEVVVTGYQQIDKRKVTSSVKVVKTEDIQGIGVASVDQLLAGQAAGLLSISTNGAPGAPSKLRIRSTVSLTGSTDPLWVLDGMILEGNDIPKDFGDKDQIDDLYQISIAGVNPSDIEDITILKDAAATAIYGARAANGVIVVRTKQGRKGKMRVNASAGMFMTLRPDLEKLNLMNATEKIDFELSLAARKDLTYQDSYGAVNRILNRYQQRETLQNSGWNMVAMEAKQEIDALRSKTTDWGKELYQNAWNQQYHLSFSGGAEGADYYFSTGLYREKGTTIGTGLERLNLTLKTDFRLLEQLKLGVSLFVNHAEQTGYMTDADAFVNPARYSRAVNPYLEVRDEEGNYLYDPDIVERDDKRLNFNILEERENTAQSLKSFSLKPMLTLNYRPLEGVNLSSHFSMQIDRNDKEKVADQESYFVRKYREKSRANGKYWLPDGGVIQNWMGKLTAYQWRLQGELKHSFSEKQELELMAGVEMRGDKTEEIHTKGFGYDSKSMTTSPIVFPENSVLADQEMFRQYRKSFHENRYLSYYMSVSYVYDNRFVFFGSVRYDGSNLFGVDRKYKYLPLWAVSGAWHLDRESFLQEVDWLTHLKLRLSYGLQGNVDKNTSAKLVGEWKDTSILPDFNEDYIDVNALPNPYLRWEKTSNWNLGVDMGVWKNRISFTMDLYRRISDDLIAAKMLPGESGFGSAAVNWAKVTNQGIEVSLSTVNVQRKNFQWTTDFNVAHNKSRVNRIQVAENALTPSLEGYEVGALFQLKTAGLDGQGLPMFWRDGEKVSFYDFFKLKEGYDPLWGETFLQCDLTNEEYRNLYSYAGSSEPKFVGGLTNRFRYRNFDLTIATNFVLGQTIQETPFYSPTETSPGQNYSKRVADIWSVENPNGIYPTLLGRNTMENNVAYLWHNQDERGIMAFRSYDFWFKTMNYLRVNSIRLGYSLSETMARKLRLSQARISVEARNPFVFGSNYTGYFDPESYGNIYAQPMSKTFSVGLDLTF